MEFHVACVQTSARVAKVMNFGGWNTVACIMSAQVITTLTMEYILHN